MFYVVTVEKVCGVWYKSLFGVGGLYLRFGTVFEVEIQYVKLI